MSPEEANPRSDMQEHDRRRLGLCATCSWVRSQPTKRGSTFYRCARADEDPAFMQYPNLPVLRCVGFEKTETTPLRED